jgi:PAS domain S-box-containing protein
VLAIGSDVTDKVLSKQSAEKSKHELKRANQRIADILERTTDAFYSVDGDFRFTYVNKRAVQLWGREHASLIGKHYWTEFPNAVGSVSYHKHYEALQQGNPVHFEVVSPLLGTWIEVSIYPGKDGGLSVFFRDISERKQTAEELERKVNERTEELEKLNHELKRSNKNLEEFAYAASHDMKEPIRKIHFFADRLKERLSHKMEEEDHRYFKRLEAGTNRMVSLIDDLLVYSHVTRGVSSVETVDLNQMLSFVLDDLELHIEELGAKVEVGSLPTIKGRPRQLQQLFENLIGNALKYRKQDIVPEVHITSRMIKGADRGVHSIAISRDKEYHLIEVKDNGIGFEQSDAERIFNVFTRLHGNSEYRGTGVGLSIVQKVVENHHGNIWAESTPGEGATFRILLPIE